MNLRRRDDWDEALEEAEMKKLRATAQAAQTAAAPHPLNGTVDPCLDNAAWLKAMLFALLEQHGRTEVDVTALVNHEEGWFIKYRYGEGLTTVALWLDRAPDVPV